MIWTNTRYVFIYQLLSLDHSDRKRLSGIYSIGMNYYKVNKGFSITGIQDNTVKL